MSRGITVRFLASASDWGSGGDQFPPDENTDVSLNVVLLVIHPSDATASLKMFRCPVSFIPINVLYNIVFCFVVGL